MDLIPTNENNSKDGHDGQNKLQPTSPKTSPKKKLCVQSYFSLSDGNGQTKFQSTLSKPSPKKKCYVLRYV